MQGDTNTADRRVTKQSSTTIYMQSPLLITRRAYCAHLAGPMVTSQFVSVCPSIRARSGEAWEWVNGGSWQYGCFELASWFARLLVAKQCHKTMLVLSAVKAQLLLHKRNVAKAAPEAREWQENGG